MPSVKAKTVPKKSRSTKPAPKKQPIKKQPVKKKVSKAKEHQKALEKQYKKYLKRIKRENEVRALRGLPLIEAMPFQDEKPNKGPKEVSNEINWRPYDPTTGKAIPRQLLVVDNNGNVCELWPWDEDGKPWFEDKRTGERRPTRSYREEKVASLQRTEHYIRLKREGTVLPKSIDDEIKWYVNNWKYDGKYTCKRVIDLARSGAPTMASIVYELGITRNTHNSWVEAYDDYRDAVEMAKDIMNGIHSNMIGERYRDGRTKDADYFKFQERFGTEDWADPRTTAQQESNDIMREVTIMTGRNLNNVQKPPNNTVIEEDGAWSKV